MKCLDCHFYEKDSANGAVGYCHRYPPTLSNGHYLTTKVFLGYWCGEFQPKQTASSLDEIARVIRENDGTCKVAHGIKTDQ